LETYRNKSLQKTSLIDSQSRQSTKLSLQSSEMGPSTPSPAGECVPPPFGSWGETDSLAGEKEEGGGGPDSDEGDIHCGTLGIYVLRG
jgi:hypothetical protein